MNLVVDKRNAVPHKDCTRSIKTALAGDSKMDEVQTYKAAIFEQAKNATMPDALFERISDESCRQIANEIATNSQLRAAILHDNCVGLIDTYLLSVAEREA